MSSVNYDFFVHVLLMLYKEMVEEQIAKNDCELSDKFWEDLEA
jgi:hypothetical protein